MQTNKKSANYSSFFTKNKVAKIDDVSSSSLHLQEAFLLQSLLLLLLVLLTNGYGLAVLPNSRKTISRS
jgi:hypothetical protein